MSARTMTDLQDACVWQPIETAPKDGTSVLLYLPEGDRGRPGMEVGQWWGDEADSTGCWWSIGGPNAGLEIAEVSDVTHWMPLPPPPDEASET